LISLIDGATGIDGAAGNFSVGVAAETVDWKDIGASEAIDPMPIMVSNLQEFLWILDMTY
jgi:hypothetical protein